MDRSRGANVPDGSQSALYKFHNCKLYAILPRRRLLVVAQNSKDIFQEYIHRPVKLDESYHVAHESASME